MFKHEDFSAAIFLPRTRLNKKKLHFLTYEVIIAQ